uniref:Uncharacterized protein n=1 Tax=Tanacetum cinerariifolium TaxID=118510 RepID=A0A6L2LH93_TANCI|nr:hypothetical protein [Tanacetum cinerariifolium]
MTPVQALTTIQTMADHSQKWHDGTSNRNIESSSSSEGITTIVNKLKNLGRDMNKLKENVHAIQVGCQIFEGTQLDKDFHFYEEIKSMEEVKYGEFGRPFPINNKNDGFLDNEKQETDDSEMAKALAALEATLKKKKEEPKKEKKNINYYVDPYELPIPFPMKSLKKIKINRPLLKDIRQTDYYAKQLKDLVENKPRTDKEK